MLSAIDHLFAQPAAQAVAWALLQFVWQGAVIGVITAAALSALRRSAPDVRYVVATIGLSLMLTMPVVSAVQAWRTSSDRQDAPAAAMAPRAPATESYVRRDAPDAGIAAGTLASPLESGVTPASPRNLASVENWNSLLSLMLLGWVCGVGILTLRLLSGWIWVRRMTSHGYRARISGDSGDCRPDRAESAHQTHGHVSPVNAGGRPDRHRLAEAGRAGSCERP